MPSVITPCGGGSSGGIVFDLTPQPGGFLRIDAATYVDIRAGTTINVQDNGGGGIYLSSKAGASGDGFIGITIDGELFLDGYEIILRTEGGPIQFQTSGNIWARFNDNHSVVINLGAGRPFVLTDDLGNAILTVADGGEYHIKAGAAWVADL